MYEYYFESWLTHDMSKIHIENGIAIGTRNRRWQMAIFKWHYMISPNS